MAAIALLLSAGVARADPAPAADPSMALATSIIEVIIPPDHSDDYVGHMVAAIAAPTRAQLQRLDRGDPAMHKLIDDYTTQLFAITRDIMIQDMPALRAAMAHAYSRNFTRDELAEILAFARTPTGAKYLSRAADLMQDSEMQALMLQIGNETRVRMDPLNAKFRADITAYSIAHPEAQQAPAGQH